MVRNKTVLVTLDYPPDKGGVARMYGQIAECLVNKLDVVVNRPNEIARNTKVIYRELVNDNLSLKWWPAVKEIYQLWKSGRYKKVVIGQVLPLGSAAFLVSLITDLKYDVFVHGMDITLPQQSFRKKLLVKLVFKRAHKIIAANKYVSGIVTKIGIRSSKVEVVYPVPGVTQLPKNALVAHLSEAYKLTDKPVLLTVTRLVQRKGIQHVIAALEKVWQKYPDTHYVVCGSGPYQSDIEQSIQDSSRPKNIHLLTNQDDGEVSAWYQLATMFIMTPYTLSNGDYEGFGIVYLEAASHMKPSIATRHGGINEAVLDEQTGLLVEEGNVSKIAEAIIKLIENHELAETFGKNGAAYVQQSFTLETMKEKLSSLYG